MQGQPRHSVKKKKKKRHRTDLPAFKDYNITVITTVQHWYRDRQTGQWIRIGVPTEMAVVHIVSKGQRLKK